MASKNGRRGDSAKMGQEEGYVSWADRGKLRYLLVVAANRRQIQGPRRSGVRSMVERREEGVSPCAHKKSREGGSGKGGGALQILASFWGRVGKKRGAFHGRDTILGEGCN